MAVEYKFKPYTPQNLKLATPQASLSQQQKTLKSLQSQKANLDARLRAEGIDPGTLGGEFDNRNLIEKALNLRPDQGLLMDFFEVINRPVEAVKSAITAGIEGENVLEGAWKGISGQELTPGSELFKDLTGIEPETGFGKFVADIGADILLDPLTYLPAGFFVKGLKKLGSVGSRTLTTVGEEIVSNSAKVAGTILKSAQAGDEAAIALIKSKEALEEAADLGLKYSGAGGDAEKLARQTYEDGVKKYLKDNGLEDLLDEYKVIIEGTTRKGRGNLKDLAVYYRVKGADGLEQWVKINKIEVKDITKGGAFGITGAFGIDDFGKADAEKILGKNGARFIQKIEKIDPVGAQTVKNIVQDFLSGKPGAKLGTLLDTQKYGEETVKNVKKVLEDLFFEDLTQAGVTHLSFRIADNKVISMSLANAKKYMKIGAAGISIKKTAAAGQAIGRVKAALGIGDEAITIAKGTDYAKKAKARVIAAAKGSKKGAEMIVQNSHIILKSVPEEDIVKLVGKTLPGVDGGTSIITKVARIDDNTLAIVTSSSKAIGAGTQVDLISSIKLVDDANKPLTEAFLESIDETSQVVEGLAKPGQGSRTITETLTLAGRAREGDFGTLVQRIAKAYKNFEINFKLTFGLYEGLSPEAAQLLKKAYGENLFELERRSARLAELKKKLIAIDPNAGELLGEIVEAQARIANGNIVRLSRRMGKSDFLDYALKRSDDGLEIVLPSFPDEVAKQNFLKDLNDLYRKTYSTTDDFFEVAVGANGGTVLKYKGDASELRDVIKYYNDQKLIRPALETGDYVYFGEKSLSSNAKKLLLQNPELIQDYQNLSNEILQELVDVAGFDNLPMALSGQIGYMRHIMSKEAFAQLQRTYPLTKSIFSSAGTDVLKSRTFIGSAQEINAALKDFAGLSTDLFDPNAFNAMEDLIKVAQRKLDQHRVLEIILQQTGKEGDQLLKVVDNVSEAAKDVSPYDRVFKDFKEEFSALYKNLSPNSQKILEDYFKAQGYGAGKAVVMNKSAFNILKGAEKAYVDLPKFVGIYDKFLNSWKGLTLVSPGFHLRNMFGNMFNSYAAGMDVISQGRYLTTAVTELDEFQRIGKKLAQGLDITPQEKKLFDLVRNYFENGVSQTHRGIRDLETVKDATAATIKGSKLKTGYNSVIRFNFNVAERMDDIQRYALYRWSLDKTNDVSKAARTVTEALFDYSALTPFEKDYMKRIFPFYTFMKNNFIFQAKNIFANPKQYARVGRAYKYGTENLSGYGIDDMPDYAVENMWIPIPMSVTKNDKKGIAFLKANLPIGDFTELVENPFRKGVTSITAPVKLLIEFGAGRDMFTGAPLQNFPGETRGLEPGTGVLAGLRDPRGNLTISQSPLFQKILGDIGLRTPINFASTGLDLVDTLAGYQGGSEGLGDFMARMGIVGVQETENLELTKLYQDLEKLRELKKYYEQETGNQLPVLPRG
jgi:hypothetical protein